MPAYRTNPRYPLEITDAEAESGFDVIGLLIDREPTRVLGLVLEPWELVVKVDSGYQVLRYGWIYMPRNVRPRPSDLCDPDWHFVVATEPTIESAMKLSRDTPIIEGPVEVTDGAEIVRVGIGK